MNNFMKVAKPLSMALACTLLLASCVRDGEENCDSFLKFEYSYNVLEVDAFHKQATEVRVYLFDSDNTLLTQLNGTVPANLESNTFRMKMPEGYEKATRIVAWAGLNDTHHVIPNMAPGVSTMDDLRIVINATMGDEIRNDYAPMLWGLLELGEGIKYLNETNAVQMHKNTNSIRIVLQSDTNEPFDIDPSEFSYRFYSANGSYSCHNQCFDGITWTYAPHYVGSASSTRADDIAVAELSTKRLLESNVNRLQIVHDTSGDTILDTDLNSYLKLLQLAKYSRYDFQEYLDREDNYGLIIFLGKEGVTPSYFATRININGFVVRKQDVR